MGGFPSREKENNSESSCCEDTKPPGGISVSNSVCSRIQRASKYQKIQEELDMEKVELEELKADIDSSNTYWEERVGCLKKTQEIILVKMEEEFNKAMEELEDIMPPVSRPGFKKRPCPKQCLMVTQCYKKNPEKPLNCAALVQDYVKCLANATAKLARHEEEDRDPRCPAIYPRHEEEKIGPRCPAK